MLFNNENEVFKYLKNTSSCGATLPEGKRISQAVYDFKCYFYLDADVWRNIFKVALKEPLTPKK